MPDEYVSLLVFIAKVLVAGIVFCLVLLILLNINNIANIIIYKFNDLSEKARIGLEKQNSKNNQKDGK